MADSLLKDGWASDRPQETRRGVRGDQMSIVLLSLGVAFAAFCIWLTVRIVNRRERWAMRLALMSVVAVLTWYALTVGPSFAASMFDSLVEQFVPEVRPPGSKS